jgi:hypothetical protein
MDDLSVLEVSLLPEQTDQISQLSGWGEVGEHE